VSPFVADFYEVPRDRLEALRSATLATLRRPVPRYESEHFYLAAVLGVVGDTPLPNGGEMLGDGSREYGDLLLELVERRGGGWEIVEPSPERIAALDPAGFDADRLRAHYAGEVDYYPDEDDDGDDEPGVLGALFDWLVPDRPEASPADAGEHMLRDIALLRMALTKIPPDSILLIHMP
jgi:hypothetical protein